LILFSLEIKAEWKVLETNKIEANERSGHTADIYKDCMYVFGGSDKNNNKPLNTLYKLDLGNYFLSAT